jgi:protein-L-isoaspartate(D-aspartate) O-methyltransferase
MSMDDKKDDLIRRLIREGYLKTGRVEEAIRSVPRELFVDPADRDIAYHDQPLPIGSGQTISAPHMVATMTGLLEPREKDVILEVGSGSGYQAAVLSGLVDRVYSMEMVSELAGQAKRNLSKAGIRNVEVIEGDGSAGLPEKAPFDKIIVTCGSDSIYPAWKDQLADGGILVVPVSKGRYQRLMIVRRKGKRFTEEQGMEVVFVPLRHHPEI